MDKPSFKLVGSPCGYHGQYTFYKAIRLTGKTERIVAIGDFFFVRVWQDSELVSIGELQLLWTDRVSDQTLVSLRLYFLPENTPDGRGQHGEDEVLAINDKVVLKAEDLLSWVSNGEDWRWGLRAVWRGACAPPADTKHTAPLHHTKLDFSDVEKEKDAIAVDEESPGVVVFSYPRYCRYRALVARLEGIQADWLRDSLVAALGGYSAPTKNTRILYCKDTFEYPELEGHEFVCNHLAPRVKGRGRPRRRRAHHDQDDRSSDDDEQPPCRPSLRPDKSSDEESDATATDEDRAFLKHLKHFYRDKDESFTRAMTLKDLSLRALYSIVTSKGGYDAVCRHKLWRVLFVDQPAHTRRHYERYLLPYERHEHRNGVTAAASGDGTLRHDVDSETGEIKEDMTLISKPAEELNREFLDSLPAEDKPAKISVRPVEMMVDAKGGDGGENQRGATESSFLKDMSMLHPPHNGHIPPPAEQAIRPSGRSSLRAVRVKPAHSRPSHTTTPTSSAPVTNFGIHRPPLAPPAATTHGAHSDDEIVEVPYKPKTPEIIDLDEYPESPQSVKKKKLDILKERGLEVTALPPPVWTSSPILTPQPLLPPTPLLTPTPPVLLNPAVQHQIMTNAQLFQMYNIIPPNYPNGVQPPKVIQGTSIFGSSNPEKTVYGNPKDPFMPPPHILLGAPIKPLRSVQAPQNPPQDILDLTCKINSKPAVEIVRVPPSQSPSKNIAQNLSKNFSIVDGKAVVGSNLEITLVNKSLSPTKSRPPLKRSSNGKFVSKTPTPPKDYPKPLTPKKNPIIVPNYQINENHSPSSSGSQIEPKAPMFLDPYMALYSLAGQMDPRQLAAYRDIMNNQVRGYSGFLNMGISNPTTKN